MEHVTPPAAPVVYGVDKVFAPPPRATLICWIVFPALYTRVLRRGALVRHLMG